MNLQIIRPEDKLIVYKYVDSISNSSHPVLSSDPTAPQVVTVRNGDVFMFLVEIG